MTDKEAQLKAKLLKMKLAADINNVVSDTNKTITDSLEKEKKVIDSNRIFNDALNKRKGLKPNPPSIYDLGGKGKHPRTEVIQTKNAAISAAKGKVKKLKKKYVDPNPQAETPEEIMQSAESAGREPTYIAQDHGHRISFRSHSAGNFRTASLNEQSGKYAKYWLLNAKDTNGNGWGIASHTAKENMKKFIGRPLVVTASSWHGASEYGDEYEHPYLPTNDISAILDHQEKFRVGSIVDVVEDSHGDWFASVEMLPKFASSRLPPFCSPAIYQLDASEAEGQISKWEALHLAALTENPAYGARIALLKGTCVGTGSECKVQFKVAKQATIECPKKKQKISRLKQRLAYDPPEEDILGSGILESADAHEINKQPHNIPPSRLIKKNIPAKDNTGAFFENILGEDDVNLITGEEYKSQLDEIIRKGYIGENVDRTKKYKIDKTNKLPHQRVKDVSQGWTRDYIEKHKLSKLKQRLYIAQQAKLQKTALSETPLNPKNSFHIRLKKGVKNELYDPKYVYYNMMNNVNKGFVKKNQLGSVQQYIRKNDLSKMRIDNPDTGSWNELGEIADITSGVIDHEDGDVSFQSKGSPGKMYYHDIKPKNQSAKLKARLAGLSRMAASDIDWENIFKKSDEMQFEEFWENFDKKEKEYDSQKRKYVNVGDSDKRKYEFMKVRNIPQLQKEFELKGLVPSGHKFTEEDLGKHGLFGEMNGIVSPNGLFFSAADYSESWEDFKDDDGADNLTDMLIQANKHGLIDDATKEKYMMEDGVLDFYEDSGFGLVRGSPHNMDSSTNSVSWDSKDMPTREQTETYKNIIEDNRVIPDKIDVNIWSGNNDGDLNEVMRKNSTESGESFISLNDEFRKSLKLKNHKTKYTNIQGYEVTPESHKRITESGIDPMSSEYGYDPEEPGMVEHNKYKAEHPENYPSDEQMKVVRKQANERKKKSNKRKTEIKSEKYKRNAKLKARLAAVGLPDGFGKDPKKFKDFKDFLDNFNQDAGPPEHERKSPFPLPKYFEKDYEAFHNHVQDSAFRLEDAQEAGIDLEDENFSHGDDVSQSWNDVSKENQDKLRPYYQKHLSKELSWQKDPSLYTSGELPKEDQTYTKPGFHKNLTPMFENEPDGYKEINPKDIVSKTYDSTYDEPSKYSKLKARLAGLGDENMTYQNSKKVKLHKTKNMGKNDKD